MNTPLFGSGKLSDGGEICSSCSNKVLKSELNTDSGFRWGLKKYSLLDIQKLLHDNAQKKLKLEEIKVEKQQKQMLPSIDEEGSDKITKAEDIIKLEHITNANKVIEEWEEDKKPEAQKKKPEKKSNVFAYVVVGIALVFLVWNYKKHEQQVINDIQKADKLWSAGRKEIAIDKYKTAIKENLPFVIERPNCNIVFQRVIEYELQRKNFSEAKRFVKKALEEDIHIKFSSQAAKEMLKEAALEKTLLGHWDTGPPCEYWFSKNAYANNCTSEIFEGKYVVTDVVLPNSITIQLDGVETWTLKIIKDEDGLKVLRTRIISPGGLPDNMGLGPPWTRIDDEQYP